MQERYVDAAPARKRQEADRHGQRQIAALEREQRVGLEPDGEKQIARRQIARGLRLAGEAQFVPRKHALGNGDDKFGVGFVAAAACAFGTDALAEETAAGALAAAFQAVFLVLHRPLPWQAPYRRERVMLASPLPSQLAQGLPRR